MSTKLFGMWIDSTHGQYTAAMVIDIAHDFGYDEDSSLIQLAQKHIKAMNGKGAQITNAEFRRLQKAESSIEDWLNENVAPEGASFGWHENKFQLHPNNWWDEK